MDKSTYESSRIQALADGDRNFCVPMALSLVTGLTFNEVNDRLFKAGARRKGCGVVRWKYEEMLKDGSFGNFTITDVTEIVRDSGGKTVKTVARVLGKGRYLVCVSGHVLAVIDGEVCDWTENRQHRVTSVLQIDPVVPVVTPAEDLVVQPVPVQEVIQEPVTPTTNLDLIQNLLAHGWDQFEIKPSGKFVRWDTLRGTMYLSGGKRGKTVRLFIRNPETLAMAETLIEEVLGEEGNVTAKYTAWQVTLTQLDELRTRMWVG
jgi:hypothetical protein